MLKGSDARRSHSDDAAAFILRSSDGQGGLGRDFIPLRIHPMLFQPLHPHRAKRSRSDVKSDFDRLDAARPKSFKDTCGKVQPCGGCGDGTSHFGIDRLISLAISGVIGAMKVRRQWNVAKVLNGLFDSPLDAVRRTRRKPYSPRSNTSACKAPPPNSRISPSRTFLPGWTSPCHTSPSSRRVSSNSTWPRRNSRAFGLFFPMGCALVPWRVPSNRARKTRVLLKTRRSPA